MRLLMLSSEFPPGPGGIGTHAHHLARHLHRLGWDLTVVSPQDYAEPSHVADFNAALPFPVIPVPSGRGRGVEALHRIRVANRVARDERPDLLIGTGLSGVSVAAALGTMRRVRAVAVAHGSEFGTGRGLVGAVNRLWCERMASVVAVSQFTRGVIEDAGIRPRRLEVIPNAADAERFRVLPEAAKQAFRGTVGLGAASLLLTVGQVSERKGQEVVIRALPEILRAVPDAHYVMIGLPTLKDRLVGLARDLGVGDRVHCPGSVSGDEVVSWMNCADVLLMTSRTTSTGDREGFGIAAVEAALCGTPAVVSRQSGLVEAIEDGVTGLAVPENDAAATAAAVVALMTDPSRRRAMGAAARARARRDQTWETCASRYDALFRDLLCA